MSWKLKLWLPPSDPCIDRLHTAYLAYTQFWLFQVTLCRWYLAIHCNVSHFEENLFDERNRAIAEFRNFGWLRIHSFRIIINKRYIELKTIRIEVVLEHVCCCCYYLLWLRLTSTLHNAQRAFKWHFEKCDFIPHLI